MISIGYQRRMIGVATFGIGSLAYKARHQIPASNAHSRCSPSIDRRAHWKMHPRLRGLLVKIRPSEGVLARRYYTARVRKIKLPSKESTTSALVQPRRAATWPLNAIGALPS